MDNKQIEDLIEKSAEVSLDDLKGSIQFSPKFSGIDFWVADDGVYKRGPHQSGYFRSIRFPDAGIELRLRDYPDTLDIILNNWNNKQAMIKALVATGDFRTKRMEKSMPDDLEKLIDGQLYNIGAGGLTPIEDDQILIQPNMEYFIGASNSPDHIIVTKVDDSFITYRGYPYKKDRRIDKTIGQDLIARGTETWLKLYKGVDPELERDLKQLLDGKPVRTKVDVNDYQRVEVDIVAKQGADFSKFRDVWFAAEVYGGVGSHEDPQHGTVYRVSTTNAGVRDIKKDGLFDILKITKESVGESIINQYLTEAANIVIANDNHEFWGFNRWVKEYPDAMIYRNLRDAKKDAVIARGETNSTVSIIKNYGMNDEEELGVIESVKSERLKFKAYKDNDGDTIYKMPQYKVDNIRQLVGIAMEDEDLYEFLYGELGSNEGVEVSNGTIFWGADIQDYLR